MIFEIKSRFIGSVIFTLECESLKLCVIAAIKSGADLSGADLARADLARADLAGANLAGAYLAGAYLAGANLAGANLAGAYLARADLAGADLARAYLAGATYGIATLTKGLLQLFGLRWSVMIFDAHIKIGCKFHSTDEWTNFDDETIAKMSDGASEFWKKNRDLILLAAKIHQEWEP